MVRLPLVDSQQRVEETLRDPEGYFDRAWARARDHATHEVDADLAARAHDRHNNRR